MTARAVSGLFSVWLRIEYSLGYLRTVRVAPRPTRLRMAVPATC